MSSPRGWGPGERRRRRAAEAEAAHEAREVEDARRAGLTWWEKIEECADLHDVKRLLHEMADHLDLDGDT